MSREDGPYPESNHEATKAPAAGRTSIRLGKSFLRPSQKERGYYELCRPIVTVVNEGDRVTTEAHPEPIPLGLYRPVRKGDRMPTAAEVAAHKGPPFRIKSADSKGQPMELVLVEWIGQE